MITINRTAESYARERISLGEFEMDAPWEFTSDDGAALLGEPTNWDRYASYFLGESQSEPEQDPARYVYPIAKLVDGQPRLFMAALMSAREAASAADDLDMVALIDELRSLAQEKADEMAAQSDESGGTGTSSAAASTVSDGGGGGGNKPPRFEESRSLHAAGTLLRRQVRSQPRATELTDADWNERRVTLSFSSETPVPRFFGMEILDHSKGAADLSRLNSGSAALLVNHNPDDQVGVVERAWVDSDRVGRATVRFGRSERAAEILQDVKDGIRGQTSFQYEYLAEPVLESPGSDDRPATYRFPRWLGFEITLAAIPADATVGVGRSLSDYGAAAPQGEKIMDPVINVGPTHDEGIKAERDRQANIRSLGRFAKIDQDEVEKAVNEGLNVNQWRERVDKITSTQKPESLMPPAASADPRIGMSGREQKTYSLFRALRAECEPQNRKLRDLASFEFEMSQAAAERRGIPAKGFIVPEDMLLGAHKVRTNLSIGTDAKGGYTKQTTIDAANYIDILGAQSVVMPLATVLGGLNGDLALPRLTTAASGGWVAEGSGATEDTAMAFDQLVLQPKTVSHNIPITRKLLLQSSVDVENIVMTHFAGQNALKIDSAAIKGGGSNEPSGILSGGSIGATTATGTLSWAEVMAILGDVAVANAYFGSLAWITYPSVWATLKATSKDTGSGMFINDDDNRIAGFPAYMSSQVPTNLGSGTQTALIFGNMADVVIGLWGGLDLIVNPYTNATSGTIVIVALQSCDIKLRHDQSFAAAQDVTV